MKNVFFFLIAIISIGFYSCQKEPTASFTASKTTATVNETISFTNSSLEGHSFKWEFGDGTTSAEENPSHAYVSSGTYIVKLTVYSKKEKKSDDAIVYITVTDLVPTKCYLKKVTITAMPFTDGSGAGWDIYNGPDVFIEITNANNVVYQTGTTVSNVTSSMLPLTWNWSTPWQFPSLTTYYYVDLTDYDTLYPNDYIGWCGPFKMSDYMTTFPTTMTKTANGITITIEVQWGN